MSGHPWISVTGVLQTHRSYRHSTVQVLVKEASDVEMLVNKDEADFRLGRITRQAPSVPPSPPMSTFAGPQTATGAPINRPSADSGRWKVTRSTSGEAPPWAESSSNASNSVKPQQSRGGTPPTSPPTSQVFCPNCGRVCDMPITARNHQCSRCGITAEATRFLPAMSNRTASVPPGTNWSARLASSTAAGSLMSSVRCPVCSREGTMPATALYHQCVFCGVASEASRFLPSAAAKTSSPNSGHRSAGQSTATPPSTPASSHNPPNAAQPTLSGSPSNPWRAASPSGPAAPQAGSNPAPGPASPQKSPASPSGSSSNPWQAAPIGGPKQPNSGGGSVPKQRGLLGRLTKFLFGGSGP